MSLVGFLILLLVAAVAGLIAQALAGFSRGGLLAAIGVGFIGILVGDSFIYSAGRRMGNRAGASKGFLSRVVTPEKRTLTVPVEAAGRTLVKKGRLLTACAGCTQSQTIAETFCPSVAAQLSASAVGISRPSSARRYL